MLKIPRLLDKKLASRQSNQKRPDGFLHLAVFISKPLRELRPSVFPRIQVNRTKANRHHHVVNDEDGFTPVSRPQYRRTEVQRHKTFQVRAPGQVFLQVLVVGELVFTVFDVELRCTYERRFFTSPAFDYSDGVVQGQTHRHSQEQREVRNETENRFHHGQMPRLGLYVGDVVHQSDAQHTQQVYRKEVFVKVVAFR